jgi:hypothetical protein
VDDHGRFWSGGSEAWLRMVRQTSTVSKVFGSRASERYRSDLTLSEATARNDEEAAALQAKGFSVEKKTKKEPVSFVSIRK